MSGETGAAGQTVEGFRRRRRIRLAAGLTAGAVLVAGGVFWLSGGWDEWRHDRALDSACDGALAAGPLRELLGGAEVTAETRLDAGAWWQCRVSGADREKDGRIDLRVTVDEAGDRHADLESAATDAPLGHGWTGGFTFDPDSRSDDRGEARASLLLGCAAKPGAESGAESGAGISAEVTARISRADFALPETRTRLAAVLTGTASAFARQHDCAPAEGEPVREVGVSVNAWDYRPFASVSGSCAGLLDAPTAARWGVRTAVESAPGPKPTEGCTLGGLQGAPLYAFEAQYGAALSWYEREELRDLTAPPTHVDPKGHYVLWAKCPGAAQLAAYTVTPDDSGTRAATSGPALDHPALRKALRSFAARSAQTHGCTAPGTAPVYPDID
ncbi:hypothetical protein [Streptomyces fradiae]|uniref:hypothetical protein n=1 Tax=Streptomyces fradiae TaxID=1906 RepID=UPI00351539BB